MGRAFFPLDCLLRLRQDRWSDGAARVALRLALSASSFRCAAENFGEAVGVATSGARLWRLTQGCGQRLAEQKEAEAAAAFAPAEPGEGADQERLPRVDSLAGQTANLSTDGGMLHIRDEGWKEVKLSTISAVVQEEQEGKSGQGVRLCRHSYTAWLGCADDFAPYQYAEGLRRGLEQAQRLSSVNDGASWIARITELNFPAAIQILDWYHAQSRLHSVAQALWPSAPPRQAAWLDRQRTRLWQGQVHQLIQELKREAASSEVEAVTTAVGYFQENRQRMDYPRYRQWGLPIGSGTVESAVQQVIQHRMHRPGRGWQRPRAVGMLFLLCELHSGRFHQTWRQVAA